MQLKIFGERNTSTNAVRTVFKQSFPALKLLPATVVDLQPDTKQILASIDDGEIPRKGVQMLSPQKEAFIDSVFAECGILDAWKHTALDFAQDSLPADVHVIIMVRHPVSWLLALHKKPYHALQPVAENFKDFILQPWRTVERDRIAYKEITPIDLWNLKMASYQRFITKHRNSGQFQVVKFEDFAKSQRGTLLQVCQRLKLNPARLMEVEESTKGECKDVHWYRDYYSNERWRREVSETTWPILRRRLDHDTCRYFDYNV